MRGLDLTAGCLLYLVTFGLVFFLDFVSQLTSDVEKSVPVSLNRCFFTFRLPCTIPRKSQRGKDTQIIV